MRANTAIDCCILLIKLSIQVTLSSTRRRGFMNNAG
jgi:hypothetical protein